MQLGLQIHIYVSIVMNFNGIPDTNIIKFPNAKFPGINNIILRNYNSYKKKGSI